MVWSRDDIMGTSVCSKLLKLLGLSRPRESIASNVKVWMFVVDLPARSEVVTRNSRLGRRQAFRLMT